MSIQLLMFKPSYPNCKQGHHKFECPKQNQKINRWSRNSMGGGFWGGSKQDGGAGPECRRVRSLFCPKKHRQSLL